MSSSSSSRSRINISLDVGGHEQAIHYPMPLHVLIVSSLSGHRPLPDIKDRPTISLAHESVDDLLSLLEPMLRFRVHNRLKNNDETLNVHLTFQSMQDFHPDHLVHRIPEMKRWLAMRNLLTDLRANLIENKQIVKALSPILQNPKRREDFARCLEERSKKSIKELV